MRRWIWIAAVLTAQAAWGDVLYLNDGSKLEGTIKREEGGWAVTDSAGKVQRVGDDRIKSIEKSSNLSPEELAEGRLASLRRATENLSDPAQGVERFRKFIDQNKNTKAALAAQKDLDAWQDRVNKGLVKAGGQWLTREQRAGLLEKIVLQVEKARDQIKQGRLRDADATVTQILAVDPASASGLYLRGVVAFKQDQLGVAKKHFEQVREALPEHAPTLNNLAVALWRQRQQLAALALYDQAMAAAPGNRQVLDNVAEALNALPEGDRGATVAKKAAKRFIEQDTELQRQLGADGLYRWGAAWVTRKQMDEVKAAQEKNRAKREALMGDYEKLKEQLREIERRIDTNEYTLRRIQSDRTMIGAGGQVVTLPPPSVYYELRRDNRLLRDDAARVAAKMEGFPARLQAIEQDVPVPAYTGAQRLIEAEGTPLAAPGK